MYVQRSFANGIDNHMVQTLETQPTVYRDGLQLTLNLKKIGCVVDDRDGRTKVKAFYEINDQNPVELERGSKLNSLLKRQLADGIELFVDI